MNAFQQERFAFQQVKPDTRSTNNRAYNSPFTTHRFVVQSHRSSWARELEGRFNELTSLKVGWDGYNGVPVSFTCATFAALILERLCTEGIPAPSLVPGSDGTIQIEWHRNQYDVEIDVLGANNVVATRYDLLNDIETAIEVQNNVTPIMGWVSDLSADRRIAHQVEA